MKNNPGRGGVAGVPVGQNSCEGNRLQRASGCQHHRYRYRSADSPAKTQTHTKNPEYVLHSAAGSVILLVYLIIQTRIIFQSKPTEKVNWDPSTTVNSRLNTLIIITNISHISTEKCVSLFAF